MNSKAIISVLALVVVGIVGFMVYQTVPTAQQNAAANKGGALAATIYKSPTCGCCGVYASYMEKEGYDVLIRNREGMNFIKQELGVPYDLESCHTMEVGGYVVEGHVPEEAVQKLLTEKPDIKGIGMAGMPSGSPGMPEPKTGDFVIYEITHEGKRGDVFMTI